MSALAACEDARAVRKVTLAVREALRPHLSETSSLPLLIGFSGGPDSMALALACRRLRLPVILAHLDHCLRPESAAESAPDGPIARFAAALGVPCEIGRVDVGALAKSKGMGLEEAGREARAGFWEVVRKKTGCQWILLGHQADDLLEDLLLRLIRGAGWPALAGMPAVDTARRLIRPLLSISRVDIEAFVRAEGFSWIDDSSNASDDFRRNRLRHHVVPLLLEENPALHDAVLRLWEQAREDERFWQKYLAPVLSMASCASDSLSFPEDEARALPRAARLRLFSQLLRMAVPEARPRADTLFKLDKALMSPLRPRRFQFPGGAACVLSEGRLRFQKNRQ